MKITGECHCGELSYEAEINPENVVICHCTDCQSLSGSAFRSVALTEIDAFSFTSGKPGIYVKIGDSGNRREQAFCTNCGSPIYAAPADDGPKQYGIRLGTVEQRNQISPKMQIWHRSSQAWTQDISSLPAIDKAVADTD